MPDYETSGEKSACRSRRPETIHAAEVTKKSGVVKKEDLEQPPAFQGRKLAGAKNFLTQQPQVSDQDVGSADQHASLSQLPGTEASTQASTSVAMNQSLAVDMHPLATHPNTRRFWGPVFGDMVNHPDIRISLVCKTGHDKAEAETCTPSIRAPYRNAYNRLYQHCIAHGRVLHLITYRPPPILGEYLFRKLDLMYREAQAEGLDLPVSSSHFCQDVDARMIQLSSHIDVPESSKSSTREPASLSSETATPSTSSTSRSNPTYSQIRDSYHDLKDWAVRVREPAENHPLSQSPSGHSSAGANFSAARTGLDYRLNDEFNVRVGPDMAVRFVGRDGRTLCYSCELARARECKHKFLDSDDWTMDDDGFDEAEESSWNMRGLDEWELERRRLRQQELDQIHQQELEEAGRLSRHRLRLFRIEQIRKKPRLRRRLLKEMTLLCSLEVRHIVTNAMTGPDADVQQ